MVIESAETFVTCPTIASVSAFSSSLAAAVAASVVASVVVSVAASVVPSLAYTPMEETVSASPRSNAT